MSELEMKTEAEVEDFTDELSDEALDRAEGGASGSSVSFGCASAAPASDAGPFLRLGGGDAGWGCVATSCCSDSTASLAGGPGRGQPLRGLEDQAACVPGSWVQG